MDNLIIEIETISDDINDFLEENFIYEGMVVDEMDSVIERINELRTMFRRKHKELKPICEEYDTTYGNDFNEQLNKIKEFILKCNEIRHKSRVQDHVKLQVLQENEYKQVKFILQDVSRCMDEVEREVKINVQELEDDEITRRKQDFSDVTKKVYNLSKRIPDIIGKLSENDVDDITKRYEVIISLSAKYEQDLKKMILEREIEKESLFKERKLNIKLGKFKGYDSAQDIYSFKDDFEKLYSKTTPKRLMCDLLRNNHLDDPALSLVKSIESIDEAWSRLKQAYGEPKVMLNRKIMEIRKLDMMWKTKDSQKIADILAKIISLIKDMMKLCQKHNIEATLYHGNVLEQIYKLMGDSRVTRWLSVSCDKDLDEKENWVKLVEFLEKELKIHQTKSLVMKKDEKINDNTTKRSPYHNKSSPVFTTYQNLKCAICNADGHVATSGPYGTKVIQYFTCKHFVEMTPKQRYDELHKKNLCYQCLLPHAKLEGKHKEGKCQRDFSCKHSSHSNSIVKKHVLVCSEHSSEEENKQLFQKYKERFILKQYAVPSFSKNIQLSFYTSHHSSLNTNNHSTSEQITNDGIYMLQTIEVKDNRYTLFYDSGCGDFVSRKSAIDRIGDYAKLEYDGPVQLGGVGGISTESQNGIYAVTLPLKDGNAATMTGVCLDEITTKFPDYPIHGKVLDDIKEEFIKQGGCAENLPKLPKFVGGSVDFMIGIKYLRYHPQPVFYLPSGLTVFKSMFLNFDGSDGVIGGPHEVFTNIARCANLLNTNSVSSYLCNQMQIYKNGFQIDPDVSIIGYKTFMKDIDVVEDSNTTDVFLSRKIKQFTEVEDAGSKINYRCIKCRSCKMCKDHDETEEISIREEAEQQLINNTVFVDTMQRETIARLPFIHDPKIKLSHNKDIAMKVYRQQTRKLQNNRQDKEEIIKSEAKLHTLGHVDYLRNLTEDQQRMLHENKIQNFIPWRAVWKTNSLSTPCRIVFDASQATSSGYSLNDLLAKGRNNLNKLQEVTIRWMMHRTAFHTDVQKMYNSVKLVEEDWCYQRYLWQENLDINKIPEEKIIKTLIYGVKCSGNQAEHGLRLTAKISENEYPDVAKIIRKDIYVDDCLSGTDDEATAKRRGDELELVVNRGGFTLKGITYSGADPHESLSEDGSSICVAGMKWYPKIDELSLDINPLCFSKKVRGRKVITEESSKIPLKLTRRHCASKVAEVFDLTGKVMPLVSSMKIDLHELVTRKLDWDDVIPENLRSLWLGNFEMIQEMKTLRYKRAIVPSDAANLNINTLDFGDASFQMACSAIYARFLKKDGSYSCQLVLARSKIIPENTTQPRAELIAALLNTHTGEVVKRAFGDKHLEHVKISDSQIVLHWLRNEEKSLKQWVRNRILEIKRFTEINDWYYTESKNMIADLGTRKGAQIEDVADDSEWICGFTWMRKVAENMPIQKVSNLNLKQDMIKIANQESAISTRTVFLETTSYNIINQDRIKERYQFSQYLIDPNKFCFHKVVRIMAIVQKFVKKLKSKRSNIQAVNKIQLKDFVLTDEDIEDSEIYFFKKATNEIKKFNKEKFYNKFSQMKDGILWYTGRILPDDEVSITGRYTAAMIDLCSSSFCVPVVDKFSPIAFSIVYDIHWNNANVKHRGVETVWREVLKKVFIIEGRGIVKTLRKNCPRCRYLNKKKIDVAMGTVSSTNMTIAPAFYHTQVDLAGPFQAFSQHYRRTTIKVWLVVFCCSTTSTVNIKVMEDYSSSSFIQAFIRFSCEVGYPKMLLPDEGSQLVKSCEEMRFNFHDIKNQLHRDVKVEFDVCPVGGHNMHGKVERKIKEIKLSIENSYKNERLSIIQWETVSAQISNSINDMPLALGNIVSDYEEMDLLTPNRLKLGRNNNRSPEGVLYTSNDTIKFLDINKKIFNSWFETWLLTHLPKLMHQPKWFDISYNIQEGDIVLFLKQVSSLDSKYQYGMVKHVEKGKDGKVRKVNVKYRNGNENCDRDTYRSVRELVLIHSIDDIDLVNEIREINQNIKSN